MPEKLEHKFSHRLKYDTTGNVSTFTDAGFHEGMPCGTCICCRHSSVWQKNVGDTNLFRPIVWELCEMERRYSRQHSLAQIPAECVSDDAGFYDANVELERHLLKQRLYVIRRNSKPTKVGGNI